MVISGMGMTICSCLILALMHVLSFMADREATFSSSSFVPASMFQLGNEHLTLTSGRSAQLVKMIVGGYERNMNSDPEHLAKRTFL